MDRQRRSMSNSSEGVRWSLDSIELEQPSLRLISPGEESLVTETHVDSAPSASGPTPSDVGTQSSGNIDDIANPKVKGDTRTQEPRTPTHARARSQFILLDWWEEIVSLIVAIICTALSIAVLVYMNGRSLEEWKLSLQPNTLIAFLATITRAALIYPLAECLGNLKWKYFERPQKLAHLQTFDAASRGPLGACKYLWTLPIRSPLASSAAMITTLLLLFQPFAQQTIDFASRAAPMANETAHAFRAVSWNTSSFFDQSAFTEPFFPALSNVLYKATLREAVEGSKNGHCSTSLCEFADFDTLAICSTCATENFGKGVNEQFTNCYWSNESLSMDVNTPKDHSIFGIDGRSANETTTRAILQEIEKNKKSENFTIKVECQYGLTDLGIVSTIDVLITSSPPTWAKYSTEDFTGQLSVSVYPLGEHGSRPMGRFTVLPSTDSKLPYFSFGSGNRIPEQDSKKNIPTACDYVLADLDAIRYGANPNIIIKSTCLSLSDDLSSWYSGTSLSDQFGMFTGTAMSCILAPCVQRVSGARIQNNKFSAQRIRSDLSWHYSNLTELNGPDRGHSIQTPLLGMFCSGNGSDCAYSWTPDTLQPLASSILSIIDTENFWRMYMTGETGPGSNYMSFHEMMAAQITAVFQSPANPDIINMTGVAYGTKIYVQVYWMWFILPLVLLVSTLLVVILSIWDSSRKNYLFKNKILAAIAFELHGWEPHEYGVDETWMRHSMRYVEKKAERMTARMHLPQDGEGGLRLKKE